MAYSRNIFVLFALLLAVTTLAPAGGFQLNEQGARAMAQAGAFAARASDGSAIYFNPGGLGFMTQGEIYLGATMIMPKVSFYGPVQENTNVKTAMVDQNFFPINAYAAYPVSDRLVAGFGVYNPFGLGTEWPADWSGRFISIKADLKTFFFTPTIAYRLSDKFSLGIGFNYVTGSVKLTRAVAITSVAVPTTPDVTVDMSGHGFGFNVGILGKITPEFSFGVSYRSQVRVNATGTATFTPNYAVLGFPQGDISSSLTLPDNAYFGIAYKPVKDLELEADYQYIGWSTYKDLSIYFNTNNSTASTPKNYQDAYILRIGGEYTIAPFHLRAGYLFDHSPVTSAYVDPILPDANRNGLNVGLGIDITQQVSVDAAYFFLKFDSQTATNTIPETSFDGTYNSRANLFALDLEVKF